MKYLTPALMILTCSSTLLANPDGTITITPTESKQENTSNTSKKMTSQEIDALYQQADTLYKEKKFAQAAEKYRQYANEKSKVSFYNEACCWSLIKNKAKAVEALKKCLDAGWTDWDYMRKDSDLAFVQNEIDSLIQQKKQQASFDNAGGFFGVNGGGNAVRPAIRVQPNRVKKVDGQNGQVQAQGGAAGWTRKENNTDNAAGGKNMMAPKKLSFKRVGKPLTGGDGETPNGEGSFSEGSSTTKTTTLSSEQKQRYYDSFKKGDTLYDEKKYKQAAAEYEASSKWSVIKAKALYNAACCMALANDNEKALNYLNQAFKAGWSDVDKLSSDSDLKNLHDLDGFKELKTKMEKSNKSELLFSGDGMN